MTALTRKLATLRDRSSTGKSEPRQDSQFAGDLPRLLYLGDVPVDESFAGSTLLYRLFQSYPVDRLLVVETDMQSSPNGRRLDGVQYLRLRFVRERLLRSRIRNVYGSALALTTGLQARKVRRLIGSFMPDAVVSVSHGFTWMTAFRFAKANDLPFHLILHDDWRHAMPVPRWMQPAIRRRFATAYRGATECYCISRYMVEEYAREFGRKGVVLSPSRGDDCPRYEAPRRSSSVGMTYAYAGSLHNDGYRDLVLRLASILPAGSRLLVYSPEVTVPPDLNERIEFRKPLPPSELIHALRSEADVLFCPSSFLSEERLAMRMNLPSKLAEYTAVGVPILIWGPDDSSPVKWGREHPGAACVVDRNSDAALRNAVDRLEDAEVRFQLAVGAMKVGDGFFSAASVRAVFHQGLLATSHRAERPAASLL